MASANAAKAAKTAASTFRTPCGTVRRFAKDGRTCRMEGLGFPSGPAPGRSGLSDKGMPILFRLMDGWGYPIPGGTLHKPYSGERCETGGMKLGCSPCGKCAGTP